MYGASLSSYFRAIDFDTHIQSFVDIGCRLAFIDEYALRVIVTVALVLSVIMVCLRRIILSVCCHFRCLLLKILFWRFELTAMRLFSFSGSTVAHLIILKLFAIRDTVPAIQLLDSHNESKINMVAL